MKPYYDVTKIDWNDLRIQKRELLKSIQDIEDRQFDDDMSLLDRRQKDGLEGILNLIDSLQDFVVDELGYNPNEVYFLEEPDPNFPSDPLSDLGTTDGHIHPDEPTSKPIVSVWLCQHCGSNNVELKHWVNPNNGKVGTDCEDEIGYCNDCDMHSELYTADLKADAKVIGFQVVSDDESNIHPDMAGSFCIYSLSQAQAMITKGCNNPEQQWRLLTIWTDDIEEPTMMFEGDPRD